MSVEIASAIVSSVVRLCSSDVAERDAALCELSTRSPEGAEQRALATLYITNPELRPQIQEIYPNVC